MSLDPIAFFGAGWAGTDRKSGGDSETALLAAVRNGDEDAFGALVDTR